MKTDLVRVSFIFIKILRAFLRMFHWYQYYRQLQKIRAKTCEEGVKQFDEIVIAHDRNNTLRTRQIASIYSKVFVQNYITSI